MESDEDNNSVDYDSILEEIESLIAEASTQAPKAIMKFADFIASKK
jgi:dihydroneopterin aldolase